jgi:hypothetical protein
MCGKLSHPVKKMKTILVCLNKIDSFDGLFIIYLIQIQEIGLCFWEQN